MTYDRVARALHYRDTLNQIGGLLTYHFSKQLNILYARDDSAPIEHLLNTIPESLNCCSQLISL